MAQLHTGEVGSGSECGAGGLSKDFRVSALPAVFSEAAVHTHTLFGMDKGSMNLGEFRVHVSHWLELHVLGMPHLHGEAVQISQVLAEQGLVWREEGGPVILPRTM